MNIYYLCFSKHFNDAIISELRLKFFLGGHVYLRQINSKKENTYTICKKHAFICYLLIANRDCKLIFTRYMKSPFSKIQDNNNRNTVCQLH